MTGPLRYRNFRLLLAGRTVNALGNAIAPIALSFAVLDLTGSVRDLGLVVGVRTLANVLFLLFGGVLADRLPRGLVLVGAGLAAAATQGVVAALVLTGTATIPLLVGISAINGVVAALALPATAAVVPQTVPEDVRQQANALNRMCSNGAMIAGAPLGGVLVAAVGPGWGIAVDAATFAVSALCFAFLRLPAGAVSVRPGILTELRGGWTEFRSRQWLWVVVACACAGNVAWSGSANVLGPVVADQTFGRTAWGLILAAQTFGMVVGALVAIRLRIRRLLLFGCLCCSLITLPMLALGVWPTVPVLLVTGFIAGIGLEQFGIAWDTTMQEHVPADKLARVYSYDMLGSFLAMPVGEVAVGPIAEAAGLRPTLIGCAVLMFLSVAAMLLSRDVRTLRHRLPKDAPPTMKESVP
ncbi:MFS transporter [Actinoplanes sp. NPDC049802]|uniref:MFS transporter n=1 Tax=Actinoplanes sp. NPDC049802 TaxID=3154742 RepID=UPI0033DC6CD8